MLLRERAGRARRARRKQHAEASTRCQRVRVCDFKNEFLFSTATVSCYEHPLLGMYALNVRKPKAATKDFTTACAVIKGVHA